MERFIPVHTGNIRLGDPFNALIAVYPCAYREHFVISFFILFCSRFIPVHTGNICNIAIWNNIMTVYPCAYREHSVFFNPRVDCFCLSLCIQGTCIFTTQKTSYAMFIPVHTGNIEIQVRTLLQHAVYPCAYREHWCYTKAKNNQRCLSLCIQGTYPW